jgi:hypothetical protein
MGTARPPPYCCPHEDNKGTQEGNSLGGWTFKIGNDPDFDATINKLQWLGLVTFDPSSTQFFLTDFGIHYCTKYKDRLGTLAYFK